MTAAEELAAQQAAAPGRLTRVHSGPSLVPDPLVQPTPLSGPPTAPRSRRGSCPDALHGGSSVTGDSASNTPTPGSLVTGADPPSPGPPGGTTDGGVAGNGDGDGEGEGVGEGEEEPLGDQPEPQQRDGSATAVGMILGEGALSAAELEFWLPEDAAPREQPLSSGVVVAGAGVGGPSAALPRVAHAQGPSTPPGSTLPSVPSPGPRTSTTTPTGGRLAARRPASLEPLDGLVGVGAEAGPTPPLVVAASPGNGSPRGATAAPRRTPLPRAGSAHGAGEDGGGGGAPARSPLPGSPRKGTTPQAGPKGAWDSSVVVGPGPMSPRPPSARGLGPASSSPRDRSGGVQPPHLPPSPKRSPGKGGLAPSPRDRASGGAQPSSPRALGGAGSMQGSTSPVGPGGRGSVDGTPPGPVWVAPGSGAPTGSGGPRGQRSGRGGGKGALDSPHARLYPGPGAGPKDGGPGPGPGSVASTGGASGAPSTVAVRQVVLGKGGDVG